MSRDYLDRLLEGYIEFGLVAVLFAFLISAAIGLWSVRRITRPLTVLTRAAAEINTGTFAPEALDTFRNRRDELGRLTKTFQNMMTEVQARREHLENLVAERTQELRLNNALLDKANRRMGDELMVAHSLQQEILPKAMPPHTAYSGNALMAPAREMAGGFRQNGGQHRAIEQVQVPIVGSVHRQFGRHGERGYTTGGSWARGGWSWLLERDHVARRGAPRERPHRRDPRFRFHAAPSCGGSKVVRPSSAARLASSGASG